MAKILMTSDYGSTNTYVKSIVDELKITHEVFCDVNSFWEQTSLYDIIHIQWVEELFNWKKISNDNLDQLKKQFFFWKEKGVKIVITRHNKLPHRNHLLDKPLYHLAYRNADAVVHLDEFSLKKIKTNGINVVIPHVNYLNLKEDIDVSVARQFINLHKKGTLFLSFGMIRNKNEEEQIIKAFKKIKTNNDYLLICNSMIFKKKPSFRKAPISRLKYIFKIRLLKRQHIYFRRKRILNDDLKYYLNAANVIITPRIDTLNSGVTYMGFSFSKIVIGPNIGNIGCVLRRLQNPVFDPAKLSSVSQAMIKGKSMVGTSIEKQNFEYIKTECSPRNVAKKHNQLYKLLAYEK